MAAVNPELPDISVRTVPPLAAFHGFSLALALATTNNKTLNFFLNETSASSSPPRLELSVARNSDLDELNQGLIPFRSLL